jgi:hypothetical protein
MTKGRAIGSIASDNATQKASMVRPIRIAVARARRTIDRPGLVGQVTIWRAVYGLLSEFVKGLPVVPRWCNCAGNAHISSNIPLRELTQKRTSSPRLDFHLGQIKLRHIGTPQKPIFATGRDVDLVQTTSGLTNGSPITAAEVFKMKANQFGFPALEITHERMFSR